MARLLPGMRKIQVVNEANDVCFWLRGRRPFSEVCSSWPSLWAKAPDGWRGFGERRRKEGGGVGKERRKRDAEPRTRAVLESMRREGKVCEQGKQEKGGGPGGGAGRNPAPMARR